MIQKITLIVTFVLGFTCNSQYRFEGQLAEAVNGNYIYLSIIEDYRKLSRPYLEQIIKKTAIDSSGYFKFEGDNLTSDNRIYRIHVDQCSQDTFDSSHFLGKCQNTQSILFIANNSDTITFPTSFDNEVLCELTSTNPKSDAFLQIDVLKEEMAFEFYEFPSEASRKLNSKKWFKTLQDFGKGLDEPLAELYIFDFLSDKRNETYSHYLKDLSENDYYSNLGERLEAGYPNANFTQLYRTDISSDRSMASQGSSPNSNWQWILGGLLLLSLVCNAYLISRQRYIKKNHRNEALGKLTAQEQKIANEILKDKTNKEIASDLFVSLSTVKTHINNLYKKLNVSSRDEIKQLLS